jgi:hypothetical protein
MRLSNSLWAGKQFGWCDYQSLRATSLAILHRE